MNFFNLNLDHDSWVFQNIKISRKPNTTMAQPNLLLPRRILPQTAARSQQTLLIIIMGRRRKSNSHCSTKACVKVWKNISKIQMNLQILCCLGPASARYIAQYLDKVHSELKQYIRLEMIPYGNAQTKVRPARVSLFIHQSLAKNVRFKKKSVFEIYYRTPLSKWFLKF